MTIRCSRGPVACSLSARSCRTLARPAEVVVADDRRMRIDVPLSTGTDPATARVAIRSGG